MILFVKRLVKGVACKWRVPYNWLARARQKGRDCRTTPLADMQRKEKRGRAVATQHMVTWELTGFYSRLRA